MLLNKLKLLENNPRQISDTQFTSLKNSLKNFMEMLEIRQIIYDKDFVIWGGNQRFLAYKMLVEQGEVEYDEKYFKQLPETWNLKQKQEFAIKDNSPTGLSGSYDDIILQNEWDDLPLQEWGINTDIWRYDDENERDYDENNTKESMEKFLNGNIKQIVFYYTNQEYLEIMDKINKIKAEKNLGNNTDVFNFLIETYYADNIS